MNNQSLISYSFNRSWSLFKLNWKTMIGTLLLIFVVVAGAEFLGSAFFEEKSAGFAVWNLLIIVLSAWLALGMYRVFLDIFSEIPTSVNGVFSQSATMVLYLIAGGILYGVMVVLGLVFLLIPGIFLAIKFYFYDISIVDKRIDPVEALKRSWHLTEGHWFQLLGLIMLIALLNFLGVLALLVGLLVTAPVSIMATVCAYHYMSHGIETPKEVQHDSFEEDQAEKVEETLLETQEATQ